MNKKIRVAVVGASGYTGAELIRLIYHHPHIKINYLVGESTAGQPITNIYPHFSGLDLPDLQYLQEVNWDIVDVVFLCLPHGLSQEIVGSLPGHIRVIDLSADFRIFRPEVYEQWYHKPHAAPGLQKEAVYGLTEIFREPIKRARIVACPGCYPTSALLPLVPLLNSSKITTEAITIDSKSGVTGAGRIAKTANLFSEVNDSIRAYNIADHRHLGEIEQVLTAAAGANEDIKVAFTPHVVPMNRGILSVIYVHLAPNTTVEDVRETLVDRYREEHFVQIMESGKTPSTREVYGTNKCMISVFKDRVPGRAILISIIDNLVKGASGQAVQNFNVMFDFPEKTALELIPLFP